MFFRFVLLIRCKNKIVPKMVHSPADVIANQAKTCALAFLLHDATKSGLRGTRHGVRLVQNDDFEGRTRFSTVGKRKSREITGPEMWESENGISLGPDGRVAVLRERLHFFSHHTDPAFVRGIQLQNTFLHQFLAETIIHLRLNILRTISDNVPCNGSILTQTTLGRQPRSPTFFPCLAVRKTENAGTENKRDQTTRCRKHCTFPPRRLYTYVKNRGWSHRLIGWSIWLIYSLAKRLIDWLIDRLSDLHIYAIANAYILSFQSVPQYGHDIILESNIVHGLWSAEKGEKFDSSEDLELQVKLLVVTG